MRGGGLCLIVLTVLLTAACHLPERTTPEPGSAAALGAVSDPNCRSTDPRVCPPMRAMVSTGAPMMLEEYGISAVFPPGSRVCYGLSGPHAHGFYTRLGDRRAECRQGDDQPEVSAISIWADYNAAFYRSFDEMRLAGCVTRGVGSDLLASDGEPLRLPGLVSEACETTGADGRLSIRVEAFAGRWSAGLDEPDAPYLIYSAYLNTTREKLPADKVVFERFLAGLVLTVQSPDGE